MDDRSLKIVCNIVLGLSVAICITMLAFLFFEIWYGLPLNISVVFIPLLISMPCYFMMELYYINHPICSFFAENAHEASEAVKISIPEYFCLTEQMVTYGKTKGIIERKNLEHFTKEFILANKLAGYKYSDWYAVWQVWLEQELERKGLEKIDYSKKTYIDSENISRNPS